MRKWWTGATNKVCRIMWTGEMSQPNKQGRRGPVPRVPMQTSKCLQKSRVGKALTPLLENSHDWMPFWSARTLMHMAWRGHRRNSVFRSFPCRVVLQRRGVPGNWGIFKNHFLQVQKWSLLPWTKPVKGGRRPVWLNKSIITELKHKRRHTRGGRKDRWCREYRDNECAGMESGKPKPIGS